MRKRRWYVAGAAGSDDGRRDRGRARDGGLEPGQGLTKVTLQSKWVVQSQFAGYYVAKDKGYYKQAGLDVNDQGRRADISPEQVVLGEQAEFGINWMGSTLAQRDTGNDLVNIAQVYARSGTTEVTFKSGRHQHVQEDARQEVRRLDLRQRVRAARRAREERHEPGQGRDARQAELRHARVPERRDRRRVGDDVQRARAGARDEEPGHRQALQARAT